MTEIIKDLSYFDGVKQKSGTISVILDKLRACPARLITGILIGETLFGYNKIRIVLFNLLEGGGYWGK